MNPDQRRIDSIFLAAAEKSTAAERVAYLDAACASEPELRARVERLLAAQSKVSGFLEVPAPALVATTDERPVTEQPGMLIGPYKLLEQIGEGGMGTVWMADQTAPIQRRVAVKVVKEGMDSRHVLARFDVERQALALMEHPNIAKVLDAGKTPSGRPYFVMELVKGQPITRYCDEIRLGMRERLELFGDVCRAVQHAHQKGIIHRDLKPSNVLVAPYDGKPVVKVIDFGVAKATGQRLTDKTLFTGFGALVGTPEYMSPEQAEVNNQDIDTRSDVYSLGVLLYELLTGSTPLTRQRIQEAALLEVLRMIREEEPPKPSTRLSASADKLPSISAQRKTEPARLAKLVRGELDWIVMKALEKDRGRRYETANGFARDIERYLADEPVEACPPSAGYKLRKFAHKHRKALVTTGAFVLLLVAAVAVSAWQAIRARHAEANARQAQALAEEQFVLAKEAVDKYLNAVTEDPELKNANFERLRKRLLEAALPLYQKLTEQAPSDPAQGAAHGRAYERLAIIHDDLGENAAALIDYRKMHEAFSRLTEEYPSVPDYRSKLAQSKNSLARQLWNQGKLDEAVVEYRAGLREYDRLVSENPGVPDYRFGLARSNNDLAHLLFLRDRKDESEDRYREATEILQRLVREHPDVAEYRSELAYATGRMWPDATGWEQGQWEPTGLRAAIQTLQPLVGQYPNVASYRLRVAEAQTLLARDLTCAEAEPEYRAAIKSLQSLVNEHPQVPVYSQWLDHAREGLIYMMSHPFQYGYYYKPVEAEAEYRTAINDYERLAAKYPNDLNFLDKLADQHSRLAKWLQNDSTCIALGKLPGDPLGRALQGMTMLAKAKAECSAELAIREKRAAVQVVLQAKQAAANPRDRQVQAELAASRHALGLIQLDERGKTEQALESFQQALSLRDRLMGLEPQNRAHLTNLAGSLVALGSAYWENGRMSDGVRTWQRARKALEDGISDANSPGAKQTVAGWRALGHAYARAGLWAEAQGPYDLARRLERGRPETGIWEYGLRPALLRLRNGDIEGYRQVCTEMQRVFAQSDEFWPVPWICALDDRSGAPPSDLVKWVKANAGKLFGATSEHIAALCYYRAGRLQEAAEAVNPQRAMWWEEWPPYIMNWPLLGMIHYRMGHVAEARKWLEKANRAWRNLSPIARAIDSPRALPLPEPPWWLWEPNDPYWHDWPFFEILLGEANTLILGHRGEADCLDHLHQAYLRTKLGDNRKAEKEFQEAVNSRDKVASTWLARGRVYKLLGDKQRANADFAKAHELDPDDPQIQKEFKASVGKEKSGQ
jgi:eukaryotic-like serine/threonine-protein kinase